MSYVLLMISVITIVYFGYFSFSWWAYLLPYAILTGALVWQLHSFGENQWFGVIVTIVLAVGLNVAAVFEGRKGK